MVRSQAGERCKEDVQDLLEDAAGFLPPDCQVCLHNRPLFHTLLADMEYAMASQDSTTSLSSVENSTVIAGQSQDWQD
jgi:hypothetical protein